MGLNGTDGRSTAGPARRPRRAPPRPGHGRATARRPDRCARRRRSARSAWQRQPPQSISRRSQPRHGSGIQSVPRKRLKASERYQMSARLAVAHRREVDAREWSRAAWQGTTVPDGVTFRNCRPQPFMQALRPHAVVVGHDIVDRQHALEPLARRLDDARRLVELRAARQQRGAVRRAPRRSTARGRSRAGARPAPAPCRSSRQRRRGSGDARPC